MVIKCQYMCIACFCCPEWPKNLLLHVYINNIISWIAYQLKYNGNAAVFNQSINHFYLPCHLWQKTLKTLGWEDSDHCMQTIKKVLERRRLRSWLLLTEA